MARANNIEFRVGVIVLLGLIILVVSLYWLQGYQLGRTARTVTVKFADVGTLAVGDRVTVSGVREGKVDDLKLTTGGVLVTLQLNRDVKLQKDATFTVRNLGLMGERFIAISPGTDTAGFDYSQTVQGLYDPGIPDVMGMLGNLIVELRQMVTSLRRSVASDSSLAKFDAIVGNFESVSQSLASYLDRNQSKIDQTATNFLDASNKVRALLDRNAKALDSTVARFDKTSQNFERFTYQLDTLATSARQFADMLDNDDGTLQLMLKDRRLYDDLRKAADNLDDLVSDIRANPEKYVHLKVELF